MFLLSARRVELEVQRSDVAFDHWPTHMNNRARRRVCLMTGRLACHRVFAPSRRDQDRERILVLPRLFALLHWP